MNDEDVIDLVQEKDGTYSPKNVPMRIKPKQQKRNNNNMDQFFFGMDIGLDFVEGVKKRVDRIMKLKK